MEYTPDVSSIEAEIPEITEAEYLGAGGFKAVYAVTINRKREALKVVYLPSDMGEGNDERIQLVARLKRELNVLSKCDELSLVKLGTISPSIRQIEGTEYLVYSEELLSGENLAKLIKNRDKQPQLNELVELALSCLRVIQTLWEMGYVHRDIKPPNIVRTQQPERVFILLDLGIAFKIHGTQLTASGHTVGTRLYMPPELFSPDYKSLIDFRSDIYSMGVTLYEYACGKHPLVRHPEDDFTTVYRIIKQRPENLEHHRPDLPIEFCRFVDRCLRKKPALRYADMGKLIEHLESMK